MTRLYDHDLTANPAPGHHHTGATHPASKYEDPIQDADWLTEPTTLEEVESVALNFSDDWNNPWAGLDN